MQVAEKSRRIAEMGDGKCIPSLRIAIFGVLVTAATLVGQLCDSQMGNDLP